MKFYDIYNDDLDIVVKYKLLSPQDAFDLHVAFEDMEGDSYMQEILSRIVYNIYSDVSLKLKSMPKKDAAVAIRALYVGCVLLNPGLDFETWHKATKSTHMPVTTFLTDLNGKIDFDDEIFEDETSPAIIKKIPKSKILSLEDSLKEKLIGQDEAISQVARCIKRHEVGLGDKNGPIGIFLLAGPSGTGKTTLAKETHAHLYGKTSMIRIDCGEYQHKHDVHKLIGAPPSYVGHDEGGQLTNMIMNNPNSVILLDEVEKAHKDLWDMFLRVFEDGTLTDSHGRVVDFSNTIIMMTSNLGNEATTNHLTGKRTGFGGRVGGMTDSTEILPREALERYATEALKKQFRVEFLNRIHKVVVFNPLGFEEMVSIADLAMQDLDEKLSKKGFVLQYSEDVTKNIARHGSSSISNARGIIKYRKDNIDDQLTDLILETKPRRGTIFSVLEKDDSLCIEVSTANKNKGVA